MKSKYAELFTAKLNDMDLVLFEKHKDWASWTVAKQSNKYFMVSDNFEYFLCLPQHNENGQCLHWLNGGGVERLTAHQGFLKVGYGLAWSACHEFMSEELKFRVKPKKEKRLLAINGDQVSFANSLLCYPQETQFIEIEVEV